MTDDPRIGHEVDAIEAVKRASAAYTAPVIPNEDQFTKLDPIERANVVKPIVEIGERYKRAFGGWRLLGEVMASQEQTPALWSGAALMCRAAEDRRGTQFCTLMAVVADSVRLEVLKALR